MRAWSQHIDVALLDTVVNFGAKRIASCFASGAIPRRWGRNIIPNLAPYQTFPTADGHIIIGCGNDGQYRRLCELISCPSWPSMRALPTCRAAT